MSSSKRLQRDRATPTVSIPSRFMNSRHNAQYLPSYRLDRKSYMSFRLVPKSVTWNDLERRNGPYFCVILPNFVVSKTHCEKVVDKAITIDNLRLLCLVVNVCRGTARRPRYKFVTESWNQDFMRSTYLAIVLIESCIWAYDWYQNLWLSMALNGEMALILRYFTEFGSFRGALHISGWQCHNYGQFTITMSSSKRLQSDCATPTV